MTQKEILREQADILWRVAESSGVPEEVRKELQHLASICEDMLSDLRREQSSRPVEPIKALQHHPYLS